MKKLSLVLMLIGVSGLIFMVQPAEAQWSRNAGNSDVYLTNLSDDVGIGLNNPARQLHVRGDDAIFRLDRWINSPGFIISRMQYGIAAPLKTFHVGVKAWGVDAGRFFIEDLHTAEGGDGDVRLAIDEDGYVGIGTTTPDYLLDVSEGDIGLDSGYGVKFENAAGDYKGSIGMTTDDMYITNFGGAIHFQTYPTVLGVAMSVQSGSGIAPGIAIWSLSSNGAVYSNNSVLTNVDPSSRDYKEDIQPIDLNAERVLKLEPKSFTWKSNGKTDFGYIAEEVQKVIPEIYSEQGSAKGYLSHKLEFYVIEMLKKQEDRISGLETEIKTLKARLDPGK
jgi:Chaperone of endosialidase